MVHSAGKGSGGISALIERQMRNWSLGREQGAKAKRAESCCKEVNFYITLSRECGCGAEEVADKLAARTGFQKFDKELLDYMVTRDDVRRRLYETLDNHTLSWMEEVLNAMSFGPAVDSEEYFNRLSHAILAVCHHTHAIIIGRGANFILPRECGLSVRLVAPFKYRLENFARRMELDLNAAREQMETIERNRSQFIENHFGKYAYDPRRYDLVLNVASFAPDCLVDVIVAALQAKGGRFVTLPVGQGAQENLP